MEVDKINSHYKSDHSDPEVMGNSEDLRGAVMQSFDYCLD